MQTARGDHTLAQLREVGRQVAATLAAQDRAYRLWQQSRADLNASIDTFLNLVTNADVREWNEEQFISADQIIAIALEAMERYLTLDVDQQDVGQLHFVGQAIRTLREARNLIVRGISPDPAKRSSLEESDRLRQESAERALQGLLSDD